MSIGGYFDENQDRLNSHRVHKRRKSLCEIDHAVEPVLFTDNKPHDIVTFFQIKYPLQPKAVDRIVYTVADQNNSKSSWST